MVTLQHITVDNLDAVLDLTVSTVQKNYIASNAKSLAEAHFYPEAWYRAIYDNQTLVGFVMLADDTQGLNPPEQPTIGLWRLMIDAKYQGKGYGRSSMLLVLDYAKSLKKFDKIHLSFHPGDDSPEKFYLSLGFKHTGKMNDGEHVMELIF